VLNSVAGVVDVISPGARSACASASEEAIESVVNFVGLFTLVLLVEVAEDIEVVAAPDVEENEEKDFPLGRTAAGERLTPVGLGLLLLLLLLLCTVWLLLWLMRPGVDAAVEVKEAIATLSDVKSTQEGRLDVGFR